MLKRENYFCSESKPHYNYGAMVYYDMPHKNSAAWRTYAPYSYSENNSNITINEKSAYEITVALGYQGTEAEWIASLKGTDGISPHVGENGNWFIGDFDTSVSASSGSFNLDIITNEDINSYFENHIIDDEHDTSITNDEIYSFFNNN